MPLIRPTLLPTPSFDARYEKKITFTVQSGGPQIVANKLTIRKQSDNSVIYNKTQDTFKYEHTIPANTLTNGEYYNADVVVIDASGAQSPASLLIQFRCYTTPSVKFTNIPDNNIINGASFNFKFEYSQLQGEKIDSYVLNLYDSFSNLISTSGVMYVVNGGSPYNGNYLFAGFEDKTKYSVEIIVSTINGAITKSKLIKFDVSYKKPNIFSLIGLKNNCENGYITITSNLAIVEGESNPSPPIYINNTEVDLTGDNYFVQWSNAYKVNGDFLARVWFRDPNKYKTITQFSNASGQTIKVNYMEGYENVNSQEKKGYLQVEVTSLSGMTYYIFSNYLAIQSPETGYYYFLTRVNNIYEIKFGIL